VGCWQEIVGDQPEDPRYRRGGWLDVYRTDTARRHLLAEANTARACGFEVRVLEGGDLRRHDPAFGDEVLGAIHYTESAWLDPARFMRILADRLAGLGVELGHDTAVSHLILRNGRCIGVRTGSGPLIRARTVVLAAGVWSEELVRPLGLRLPMQAGKGYFLDLEIPETPPRTACVLNEAFVAVTPLPDRLRLAGTVELSGINHRIHLRRLRMLAIGASRYLAGIASARVLDQGCALRPCTADGLPAVGPAPGLEGLFLATGHAKMGLTLGPVTGKLVCEWLLDGEPSLDLRSLRPDRFLRT
jgi:D-amino-acid dehydrogenase